MSIENAENSVNQAKDSPYDERTPIDTAHLAAQAVLADLTDRRGIKQELLYLDDDVKAEITESLAAIIRLTHTIAAK